MKQEMHIMQSIRGSYSNLEVTVIKGFRYDQSFYLQIVNEWMTMKVSKQIKIDKFRTQSQSSGLYPQQYFVDLLDIITQKKQVVGSFLAFFSFFCFVMETKFCRRGLGFIHAKTWKYLKGEMARIDLNGWALVCERVGLVKYSQSKKQSSL